MSGQAAHTQRLPMFLALGLSVALPVVIIMTLNGLWSYHVVRDQFVEDLKADSRRTLHSLGESLVPMIEAYAVHEYEKLLLAEIEHRDLSAIAVDDDNMGAIVGRPSFRTGWLRTPWGITEYQPDDPGHDEQLGDCFLSFSTALMDGTGRKVGQVTLCHDDERLNRRLAQIVRTTIIDTLALIVLLTLSLFLSLRRVLVRPLTRIVSIMGDTDADGIPRQPLPPMATRELCQLSRTINTMLESIRVSRSALRELNESLEERIGQAVEEIRQKDAIINEQLRHRALDALLVDLAHHWRQPLNAAAIEAQNIEDLLDGCREDEEIRRLIQTIVGQLQGLSDTLTRLTGFQEREASRILSFAEGLELALEFSARPLRAGGVEVITGEIDPALCATATAEDWLELVSPLFMNVVDVVRERRLERATIRVSARREDDAEVIVFEDDAGGIDEALLPERLFDAYVTSRFKSRDRGLGLYSVRNMLHYRLRGGIRAENGARGARFVIRIPHDEA